jgi:peptidoglycan/LPS O-acetylase OafA/YrhL
MHYKKIDGLRFIAIFFVLIAHFLFFVEDALHLAWYGVDLFFCISGFLITGILIKDSNESIGRRIYNFFGRRFLRIFPIYYLTIGILFLLGFPQIHNYLIYFLTYTYNHAEFIYGIPVNASTHFWSLCVEEQFYIAWPFFILGILSLCRILKKEKYYLPVLCIGISIMTLSSCAQRYFHIFPAHSFFNNTRGLFISMFALCIGALGAVLEKGIDLSGNRILKNVFLEYAVIFLLFFLLYKNGDIKYVICPFISLFLILKARYDHFSKPLDVFLSNKHVVWIGTISYGIYVYHYPLGWYVENYFFNPLWDAIPFERMGVLVKLKWNPWIVEFPLRIFLSVVVAYLSFKYLEKPILRLKDIYFGKRPSRENLEAIGLKDGNSGTVEGLDERISA